MNESLLQQNLPGVMSLLFSLTTGQGVHLTFKSSYDYKYFAKISGKRVLLVAILLYSNIALCVGQQFYFPQSSVVYPDSFAIYWTTKQVRTNYDHYTLQITCKTLFDDEVGIFEPTSDSIVLLPFTPEMAKETHMLVSLNFLKNGKPMSDDDRPRILKVAPRMNEIEMRKADVTSAPYFENLQALADAYEKERCYLNAVHVYERMIYMFTARGKDAFRLFLSRHPDANRSKRHRYVKGQ